MLLLNLMFCKFDTTWLIEGAGEFFLCNNTDLQKTNKASPQQGNTTDLWEGIYVDPWKRKNQRPPTVQYEDDSRIKRHNNATQLHLCLGHVLCIAERGKMADTLGYFN